MLYDVIILGSGPAGLTAGIYASRASLKTLCIAGVPEGGQLMTTTDVENYPGFPDAITGPDLIKSMKDQAVKFGTEYVTENAVSVSGTFETDFIIKTDSGKEYTTKTIIVATGATAKWLGLPSEERLKAKGVSACAVCDGFFFKDKVLGVVGGGDTAMEESLFLTKFATEVHVFVRGPEGGMKASKFMKNSAQENKKIKFHYNTEVTEVLGEDRVSGVRLIDNVTNEEKTFELGGLFVAIGHTPNTDFIKDYVQLSQVGYIVADHTHTSQKGVFVAGDVADQRYRQAVTAAGFGCQAALDAEKFLVEAGHKDEVAKLW